jgi:type VI secretion system protein VasJ
VTEENVADSASFAALGSSPVPGDNPAGKDARYEPEYAAVLEEIEKLSFSGPGQAISWPVVEKNAAAILADQSKDLQIAAYLGVALQQNRGLEGMLAGIRVLADLLGTYWETAWPPLKRIRGRINAVNWWHERTAAFIKDPATRNGPVPAELGKNLDGELGRLDGLISTLMPDALPLRDLTAAVRQLAAPPPEPSPGPESAPPQPAEQAFTSDAATAHTATMPTGASSAVADDIMHLRRNFVAAAQAYLPAARSREPSDASLWQLSRLVVWGPITATPASDGGRTQLPAPDMNALAQARLQLQAGNALQAAMTAETLFNAAPFCLDAQEIVYTALSTLGPQFAAAAQSVLDAAVAFITRFPGVENLAFSDGTPFAAPQTSVRLHEAAGQRRGRHNNDAQAPDAGDCESLFASARNLLAQNKLTEAITVLDDAKRQSPAANLRLTVRQVRLLCEAGKIEAAGILAETVLRETTGRDLDAWDPAAALDALLVVRDAFSMNAAVGAYSPQPLPGGSGQNSDAFPSGKRYAEMLRDIRGRIARLRPASIVE